MVEKVEEIQVEEEYCDPIRRFRHIGLSYADIAGNLDIPVTHVAKCVRGICDCDSRLPPVTEDSPWREVQVVKQLHIEHNYHFTEMADLLGCHPETARNWISRHDVSLIQSEDRTSSKLVTELQRQGAREEAERRKSGGDEFSHDFPTGR